MKLNIGQSGLVAIIAMVVSGVIAVLSSMHPSTPPRVNNISAAILNRQVIEMSRVQLNALTEAHKGCVSVLFPLAEKSGNVHLLTIVKPVCDEVSAMVFQDLRASDSLCQLSDNKCVFLLGCLMSIYSQNLSSLIDNPAKVCEDNLKAAVPHTGEQ